MANKFINICSSLLTSLLIIQGISCENGNPDQDANRIVLFDDYMHQGVKVNMSISKCNDVPKELLGKVTAVDTQSKCVRFYSGKNCTGKTSIEMMPRSPSHHYLGDWNFNDLALSAGPCRDQCDVSVTGPIPSAEEGINVTIYGQAFYQGAMETINVKGCTVIPRKFRYRIGTVNTTGSQHCFQLYNNVDCSWNRTLGQDTIELRQGTPYHDNIARWHINEVRAISHCSMKCQKGSKPKQPQAPEPEHENEVILFDDLKFKGNSLRILIETEKCVSMTLFEGWEGAANSVKMFGNNSCIVLHNTKHCDGGTFLQLNATLDNLQSANFSAVTRSISVCKVDVSSHGKPQSKPHVSKAKTRWTVISLVVVGLVGSLVILLFVGKWRNPNANLLQVFRRNQMGNNGFSAMRL